MPQTVTSYPVSGNYSKKKNKCTGKWKKGFMGYVRPIRFIPLRRSKVRKAFRRYLDALEKNH